MTQLSYGLLPRDQAGNIFMAGTKIAAIVNENLDDSSYSRIEAPVQFKNVILKTRSGNPFRIATGANPQNYVTVSGIISFALAGKNGKSILWASADSGNEILEILYID